MYKQAIKYLNGQKKKHIYFSRKEIKILTDTFRDVILDILSYIIWICQHFDTCQRTNVI